MLFFKQVNRAVFELLCISVSKWVRVQNPSYKNQFNLHGNDSQGKNIFVWMIFTKTRSDTGLTEVKGKSPEAAWNDKHTTIQISCYLCRFHYQINFRLRCSVRRNTPGKKMKNCAKCFLSSKSRSETICFNVTYLARAPADEKLAVLGLCKEDFLWSDLNELKTNSYSVRLILCTSLNFSERVKSPLLLNSIFVLHYFLATHFPHLISSLKNNKSFTFQETV